MPPHIRRIDFALDAPGWEPPAIDALSDTLAAYADVFSLSKLDFGECSLRPFEIKVPTGTQPIQSRPYRLTRSSPNKSTPSWTPTSRPASFNTPRRRGRAPLCASQNNRAASVSQSTIKSSTRSPRYPKLRFPVSTRCSTPSAVVRFSPCSTFSRGLLS